MFPRKASDSDSVTPVEGAGLSTINGLDPIFNPVQYHEELDGIALKVADICLLHVVLEKRRLSLKKSIALLKGCRDGLEFLQEKSFATDFFNMFIEDESRAVIDTVYISKLEIETLIRTPSNLMDLKQKLRLEGDLASIAKALAVGLVFFATTHANRFDIDILEQDLRTFNSTALHARFPTTCCCPRCWNLKVCRSAALRWRSMAKSSRAGCTPPMRCARATWWKSCMHWAAVDRGDGRRIHARSVIIAA